MIWWHIQLAINDDINNHTKNFAIPPQLMLCFDILALVPRPLLVVPHRDARTRSNMGDIGYHLHGYIGNLHYYFEFAPPRTRENISSPTPRRKHHVPHWDHITRKELPPDVSMTVSHFGMRMRRVEKGKFCHMPNMAMPISGENGTAKAHGGAPLPLLPHSWWARQPALGGGRVPRGGFHLRHLWLPYSVLVGFGNSLLR
jgi:hypothetical protein